MKMMMMKVEAGIKQLKLSFKMNPPPLIAPLLILKGDSICSEPDLTPGHADHLPAPQALQNWPPAAEDAYEASSLQNWT